MINAVLYQSQTGSCKRYAELISAGLHVPAYPLNKAPALGGKKIFVGWVMAGKLQGYEKAARKHDLSAVVLVGMSPAGPDAAEKARAANGIPAKTAVYVKQGAFHMDKLPLGMKLAMKAMNKVILGRLAKKNGQLSEGKQALYKMAKTGEGEPPCWDVSDVVRDFTVPGGGLRQEK